MARAGGERERRGCLWMRRCKGFSLMGRRLSFLGVVMMLLMFLWPAFSPFSSICFRISSLLHFSGKQPCLLCHQFPYFTIHEGGRRDEWLSQVSVTTFTGMTRMRRKIRGIDVNEKEDERKCKGMSGVMKESRNSRFCSYLVIGV